MLALFLALWFSGHLQLRPTGTPFAVEALSSGASLDPIFVAYASCVGLVLAVAGLALLVMGPLMKKDVSRVADTYAGWLVMAPVVLGALWLGRAATIIGIGLLSVFGFKEFARATGLYRDWFFTVAVYLGVFGLTAASLMTDPQSGDDGYYGTFMAAPVFVAAMLVTIPVLRNESKGQLQRVSLSIVGFLYFGWMFGHLAFLANAEHAAGYLLFLLFAVPISDVAAFGFGKLFGKRELRSKVSPQKTVEGSLGGFAVSMLLPWALRFSFPHFGTIELILTGLIVGVGGQLGDLTISFIKRDLGIKDMGAAIPGHGGILDRVDSLILVAPLSFTWFGGLMGSDGGRAMREWSYEPATDLHETLVERLERFPREPQLWMYVARTIGALAIRLWLRLYHRLELHGVQHLPVGRSFILVANHQSHLDAPCLTAAIPLRHLHHAFPAAAADYFFKGLPRCLFSSVVVNGLPFERDHSCRQSLEVCRELLEAKGNILILFPEGTRSETGEIGRFGPAIARLSVGVDVPVVPCHLEGAHRAFPKGARWPRPTKLVLRIAPPRSYLHLTPGRRSTVRVCCELRSAVVALGPGER